MRKTGKYEVLGNIQYFIPDSLPPKNPSLNLDSELINLYGQAMHELGKLNEMISVLPDIKRFIKAYVIKEALLSSYIEGVHTTLIDVYTQPLLETRPSKETQLVMNYTKALDVALSMIKNEGLPISSRVILNAHKALMQIGEDEKSSPGNYRKQPVRVGNLIPPPAQEIPRLMSDLENYINTDEELPEVINAGLAHIQFETIHPFLDGNGRIGRLLIVLILIEKNILTEPILYPSYYFKKNRFEYYQKLDRVRTHGDFEGWIKFYLKAIIESSIDGYKRAKDIEILNQKITHVIQENKEYSRAQETMLRALSILFSFPVISISELSKQLEMSYNTASQIISNFINLGILSEDIEQKKRGRLFRFQEYLDILEREY